MSESDLLNQKLNEALDSGDREKVAQFFAKHNTDKHPNWVAQIADKRFEPTMNFPAYDIGKIYFKNCIFKGTGFVSSRMKGSIFNRCIFENCSFHSTDLREATFEKCIFKGGNFDSTQLANAIFDSCVFNFNKNFHFDKFSDEEKRGNWKLQIYSGWKFKSLRYIAIPLWDTLSLLGKLKIFAISYYSIVVMALYVFFIKELNEINNFLFEKSRIRWSYGITFSDEFYTSLLLVFSLAISSSIYTWCCPKEIQEYSETKWTYELNQSLLKYRILRDSKYILRGISAIFLIIAAFILFSKLCNIVFIIIQYSGILI